MLHKSDHISHTSSMNWQEIVDYLHSDVDNEARYRLDRGEVLPPEHKFDLYHCDNDGFGSEFEMCNFLNALVKLMKFENILETGCEQGHGTVALAEAVRYNGIGHVTTVDWCGIAAVKAPAKLNSVGLMEHVTYVQQSSEEFAEKYDGPPFDFAFFDCSHLGRIDTCRTLLKRGKLSRIISFHDVSNYCAPTENPHQINTYCEEVDKIGKEFASELGGLFNTYSRGFRLFQLNL